MRQPVFLVQDSGLWLDEETSSSWEMLDQKSLGPRGSQMQPISELRIWLMVVQEHFSGIGRPQLLCFVMEAV